jgi:hypothetical protein
VFTLFYVGKKFAKFSISRANESEKPVRRSEPDSSGSDLPKLFQTAHPTKPIAYRMHQRAQAKKLGNQPKNRVEAEIVTPASSKHLHCLEGVW